jgi:two-component system CheB/CheR fusion protein
VIELKRDRTDLSQVIERAIESNRPFIDRRRHALAVNARTSLFVHGDGTRIAQIIGNLLHNAAKFTPEGGRIGVELAHQVDRAVIEVTDSGEGMASDQIERAFEMFARIDRKGSGGDRGLGIGLALARRLAELHGGTLTAESRGVGLGTTMRLTLPAHRVQANVQSPEAESNGAPHPSPLNIVVIEDSADVADTLATLLEAMGHQVAVASSGQSGLELVGEKRPDLVLCDLGLPEMDGVEVCRRIRRLAIGPQPVVVALTGWGRDDDRQRTREAGFDHHLVKPVAPEKLESVLRGIAS